MDPGNPDGSIINSNQELDNLAELLDVGSKEIEHCLTFKTVTAVSDKYEVPLKASDAKATCDAFSAHKCSYIGQKSYMYAREDTAYRNIVALDLFSFENHERNGFEKLLSLINHVNKRLQKSFTDNFIESIMKESI
jgi:myosin heavy subunit